MPLFPSAAAGFAPSSKLPSRLHLLIQAQPTILNCNMQVHPYLLELTIFPASSIVSASPPSTRMSTLLQQQDFFDHTAYIIYYYCYRCCTTTHRRLCPLPAIPTRNEVISKFSMRFHTIQRSSSSRSRDNQLGYMTNVVPSQPFVCLSCMAPRRFSFNFSSTENLPGIDASGVSTTRSLEEVEKMDQKPRR